MKKTVFTVVIILATIGLMAQNNDKTLNEKGEIIKKGWNFGPLPVVGFNSDLGFQYGACVDIFNYGDGSKYPDYNFKINFEVSAYTKGSSIFRSYSYWNNIIPKGVLFADFGYFIDKKFNFYGFNGYASPYYNDMAVMNGPDPYDVTLDNTGDITSAFYNLNRKQFRAIVSMRQKIGNLEHLSYGIGLAYYNYDIGRIDIPKYDDQTTLYELYCQSGLIRENEKGGGNVTQFKAGLVYNSKNYENDPTRGIYFEGTFTLAPDFIDKKDYSHITFTGVFHHYIPVFGDNLTFCYRLGVQNVLAGDIPYYAMLNTNFMFFKKMTLESFGGSSSGRGLKANGVTGEGLAWFNVELRWRVARFKFINQNWCVALNPLFDAGMVTQTFRLEEQKNAWELIENQDVITEDEDYNLIYSGKDESLHTSAGCGLKLIMNRNFVVSAEFAKALNTLDGDKLKAYIGFNYIF